MPRLDRTHFVGPLAPHVSGLKRCLLARGYTRFSTNNRLGWAAQLSRWMLKHGIGARGLSEERLAAFVRERRKSAPTFSRGSIEALLSCLVELGAIAPLKPLPGRPPSPVDRVIEPFEVYLQQERQLTSSVRIQYTDVARRFLVHQFGAKTPRLETVIAEDLTKFVLLESRRFATGTTKNTVSALRSYFGFLYVAGRVSLDLRDAIPAIAGWRLSRLPRGIEPAALAQLLQSPNRRSSLGRRDYAILILLARLGLRRNEIARLRLEDIDWNRGELLIRGKGEKHERLPLPQDVGLALSAHLRTKRDPRLKPSRGVFLRVKPPFRALTAPGISNVVAKAAKQAGLPFVGAHRLRHTLATQTLRNGGSLDEIAQLLRHSHFDTTAIYAKVDLTSLQRLTQAWPGAVS